jgi:peptide/nickel transport system permease protein
VKRRAKTLAGILSSVFITLFGLLVVTFLIGRVIPIDPAIAAAGDQAPEAVIRALRTEMGLDQPIWVQFYRYVVQILHGDFGASNVSHNLVTSDIARYFPATFELAVLALLVSSLLGVPLGVWAAVRQGRLADQVIRVVCLAGHSLPTFVFAMLSLLIFYKTLDWLPGPGRQSIFYTDMVPVFTGMITVDSAIAGDWDAFFDALAHMIQPVCILGYFSMAYITRMSRAFMLHALHDEYIITARAKGLSPATVIWKHAFPTVAVQLVTVLALTFAGLLEGSVVTETVFEWPGIGRYLTNALKNGDMNPVIGSTLLIGVIYVSFNLLADLLYRLLDPRVR